MAIREFRSPTYLHQGAIVYKTSRSEVDYILSGHLRRLRKLTARCGVKVDVAFTVKMTSLATAPTVWTNTVWEVGNVNKHDGSAVVSEWAAR